MVSLFQIEEEGGSTVVGNGLGDGWWWGLVGKLKRIVVCQT